MASALQVPSELGWERFSGSAWLRDTGCAAQPRQEETATGVASALQSVPGEKNNNSMMYYGRSREIFQSPETPREDQPRSVISLAPAQPEEAGTQESLGFS